MIQVETLRLQDLAARKGKQVGSKSSRTLRLVEYCLEFFLEGAAGGRFIMCHLRPSKNNAERVIEVVGDAPCEPPDSLKLLQSLNFLFQVLAFSPLRNLVKFPLNRWKQ